MHDRVHHAMYKATIHDRVSRARDVDRDGYIGEARAPHPPGETVGGPQAVRTESVHRVRFRYLVWHSTFAEQVEGCGDDTWRHFVQVVALMHDRIQDMMYRVMRHHAEAHDHG